MAIMASWPLILFCTHVSKGRRPLSNNSNMRRTAAVTCCAMSFTAFLATARAFVSHQASPLPSLIATQQSFRVGSSLSPLILRSINSAAVADPNASGSFSLDPNSDEAMKLTSAMGLSAAQHSQLSHLASLVVDWNSRINLVSRKECTEPIVFGRHVLPSLALCVVPDSPIGSLKDSEESSEAQKKRVADIGTGGGFPGLPLAIAYPNVDFLLVDSVGKKLTAVQDMADEIGLANVKTHHGRVEELVDDPVEGRTHLNGYDGILGRSVTAMPRFCFWISDLLKKEEGKLMYIIGGNVEDIVVSQVEQDVAIGDLLGVAGASDKRILVLSAEGVEDVARKSGETKRIQGSSKKKKDNSSKRRGRSNAKGQWKKRDNAAPKERGYDQFQRYES